MADDTTVSALNELIETCEDSEEGFRTAADRLQTTSFFQQYSRQWAEPLAAEVRTVHDRVRATEKTGAR